MNFVNIFAYIELAAGLVSAVNALMHLGISPTNPLTAATLLFIAQPILFAVQTLVPTAKIPPELVNDLANSIADAVNAYYTPTPVPVPVPAPMPVVTSTQIPVLPTSGGLAGQLVK